MTKARQLAQEGERLAKLADEADQAEKWGESVRLHLLSAEKHRQAADMYMRYGARALIALIVWISFYLLFLIGYILFLLFH